MMSGPSVRRTMRRMRHKTTIQRQAVQELRSQAETLTASGRAMARAKQVSLPPLCYVEVASEGDLQRSFFPDGMISGVGISVSDALDVCEFRTRYGVESKMLHRMPDKEFPFVSWLRRHGAQFVGKLACRTPLNIGEASLIDANHPAAVAVARRASNYAITSALMGPAALTSAINYDVVAFKPTAQSFATFMEGYRMSMPSVSVGITAARLDDIFYLWEVFTSAIQPDALSEDWQPHTTGLKSGAESRGAAGKSTGLAEESVDTHSGRYDGGSSSSSSSHPFHAAVPSGEELLGPHIELSVGYPADWIDQLCSERLLSGDEFRRRILRLASTRNAMQKNEVLEVTPLTIDIDLEAAVKAIQTIAQYELAQVFDRLFSLQGSDAAKAHLGLSMPGTLEELPDELVSAVFHGRAVSYFEYQRALRTRDSVVRATDEQFRDVDMIVTPILSAPYVSGSLRSIAPVLPFALGGNPMISVQLESDFPVALVGELGRDTGLFEDSTTFLKFVRGTSPGWWRRKFLRETKEDAFQ